MLVGGVHGAHIVTSVPLPGVLVNRTPPSTEVRRSLTDVVRPVPSGVLDWSTGVYNPRVDITKDTTTLYASDRDVFLFLVDGNRDLEDPTDTSRSGLFRGFILRNSDVGAAALTLDVFLFRVVCGNHIIWGFQHVAGFRRRHVGTSIAAGALPPNAGTLIRLFHADTTELEVDTALAIAGTAGVIDETGDGGGQFDVGVRYLSRQTGSLGGGSSEMARNVIAERILGFPRELAADRGVPFNQVKRGRQ